MQHKLSHQLTSNITIHGILLWASMGFLMPIGILAIRMSNKVQVSGRKVKAFFYLHAIVQIVAVLLATAAAVMSIRTLDNSFNNNHQRLGLALYAAMWVQFLIAVFKPSRGSKRRSKWYLVHWILGTAVSLFGIINIYTGLGAYQDKTSRSTRLVTILFTAQVSCIGFSYLLQDKWHYLKMQQGVDLDNANTNNDNASSHHPHQIQVVCTTTATNQLRGDQKVLVPEACGKRNALMNLFE